MHDALDRERRLPPHPGAPEARPEQVDGVLRELGGFGGESVGEQDERGVREADAEVRVVGAGVGGAVRVRGGWGEEGGEGVFFLFFDFFFGKLVLLRRRGGSGGAGGLGLHFVGLGREASGVRGRRWGVGGEFEGVG